MKKSLLNNQIRGYIEWELIHYHEDKRQLTECKNSFIPSGIANYDLDAGGRSGVGNPTEKAAIKIVSNPYIRTLEIKIAAIDRVLAKCDKTDLKIIELVYWRETHNLTGAAMVCFISKSGAYDRINKIINNIALEMGIINY